MKFRDRLIDLLFLAGVMTVAGGLYLLLWPLAIVWIGIVAMALAVMAGR